MVTPKPYSLRLLRPLSLLACTRNQNFFTDAVSAPDIGSVGLAGATVGLAAGTVGLAGVTVGFATVAVGLAGATVGLAAAAVGLAGVTVGFATVAVGLAGATVGFAAGTAGLAGATVGLAFGAVDTTCRANHTFFVIIRCFYCTCRAGASGSLSNANSEIYHRSIKRMNIETIGHTAYAIATFRHRRPNGDLTELQPFFILSP